MNILKVQNVSKKFGNHKVLRNLSFTVPRGAIVGLIGPNGVGKSTIMKIILGIYSPDSGKITLSSPADEKNVRRPIGALIESPAIYPFLTGRQQLMLYSHKDTQNVHEIIQEMAMGDYIDKTVAHYSLGMKQKMGIAIALLRHPNLVILDEPMNGLDPISNRNLRSLILKLAKNGTTFLISSHILSELEKIIDQVVLLDKGHVVLTTSMAHLHEIGANYLSIRTTDNGYCANVLAENKFNVINNHSNIHIPMNQVKDLDYLFSVLLANHIQITDVQHLQEDLEDLVLTLLENKKEGVL